MSITYALHKINGNAAGSEQNIITLDVIEQHLRSLQSMREDVNQRQIISIIRTKLPQVVIARLEQQKDSDTQWTVESL